VAIATPRPGSPRPKKGRAIRWQRSWIFKRHHIPRTRKLLTVLSLLVNLPQRFTTTTRAPDNVATMQNEWTDPVTYALTVARACAELATDAVTRDGHPTPLAAAISSAAKSAAERLDRFLVAKGDVIAPDVVRTARHAQADLKAVAEITGLVVTHCLPPGSAAHVAQSARLAAEDAVKHLTLFEELTDM